MSFCIGCSHLGSPQYIICLHLSLSLCISSFTTFPDLFCSLSLFLLFGSFMFNIFPIYPLSPPLDMPKPPRSCFVNFGSVSKLLNLSCPYDVIIFNPVHSGHSLNIVNIFNSITSSSPDSCLFLGATISKPYIILGLTKMLQNVVGVLLSSHIYLHPLHHPCTLFFTSLAPCLLHCYSYFSYLVWCSSVKMQLQVLQKDLINLQKCYQQRVVNLIYVIKSNLHCHVIYLKCSLL